MRRSSANRLVKVHEGRPAGDAGAAGAAPPAIVTRGLTMDFAAVRALDGLTLEVPRGAIFGFLGRNGAGKTTTIRLLLGLLEPTGGEALVLGSDPRTDSASVRRRSGVLLEHPGLSERISAEANLDLFGRIWHMRRDLRRARTEELLRGMGLWERRGEAVRGWSRGMKQRLAIARALMHRPSLIFLDEPTAGLDPVSASELRDRLLRLASRERVTVFLTTHNMAEAEKLCDLVAVIRQGRLLSLGTPDEIGARHTRPRLRVAGTGFTENVLDLVRGRSEVVGASLEEGRLLIELADDAKVPPLVTFLVRIGVEIEEVARVGNSLEDGVLSLFHEQADPADQRVAAGGGA